MYSASDESIDDGSAILIDILRRITQDTCSVFNEIGVGLTRSLYSELTKKKEVRVYRHL